MRRNQAGLLITLIVMFALVSTGCSKAKEKEAELQGEIAQLQAQIRLLESRNKATADQNEMAALKAAEEKRQVEETLKAFEVRVLHDPLEAFKIEPFVPLENGWLLLDGERTFTLLGHPNAVKVSFYWADGNAGFRPHMLAEDSNGTDGWTWKGSLPFSTSKGFWAEIQYSGGMKVTSPVLPIRNAGK